MQRLFNFGHDRPLRPGSTVVERRHLPKQHCGNQIITVHAMPPREEHLVSISTVIRATNTETKEVVEAEIPREEVIFLPPELNLELVVAMTNISKLPLQVTRQRACVVFEPASGKGKQMEPPKLELLPPTQLDTPESRSVGLVDEPSHETSREQEGDEEGEEHEHD